ncbi:porin [Butyricimonas synergistica]|uniref:porin n=1 Tax=Butyricimonas synergistica TaxID=544644 RepID=UPI00038171B9|nr:porin [Butyricimonas synergistica]
MKKSYLLNVLILCGALLVCTSTWAKAENDGTSKATGEATQANDGELTQKVNKLLSLLPKFSGYIQTGYNWGDKNGDNRSSFQLKRMRLIIDKQVSKTFDFRAQLECFSGSTDGTAYAKKVITVMDAYVNAHITSALHFRAGQYYLPLGFENYDISPATLETVDFSNICYRMVCRNAVSTPNLIDYGRDLGIMAYGDFLPSKDKKFNYLSYQLSLTNGYLPTLNDDNKSKDFVGRITVRPIEKLRIIGCYNWGEYKQLNAGTVVGNYQAMNRVITGAWYYDPNGLDIRAEYGHIKSDDANVDEDGFYALAAYRFGKFIPVVRYDMYRDKANKTSANNKDNYLIGCTYELIKDVKFQLNYIISDYTDKVDKGTGNSLQIMCLLKF